MLFGYYGYKVPQARIVKETMGSVLDKGANSKQVMANLNRVWKDDDGARFRCFGDATTSSVSNIIDDLTHDRPLIVVAFHGESPCPARHLIVQFVFRFIEDALQNAHVFFLAIHDLVRPYANDARLIS